MKVIIKSFWNYFGLSLGIIIWFYFLSNYMCVNNILVGLDKVKTQYVSIHTLQKDQKNKKKGAHEDLNLVGNEKVQYTPENY